MIMIPCNYLGYELVKCEDCGMIYPIYERDCPDCGSSKSIFLREEREDDA